MSGIIPGLTAQVVTLWAHQPITWPYWYFAGAAFVAALALSWREAVIMLRPALRLEMPDPGKAGFHRVSERFAHEEDGEEENGEPRYLYNEAHETWRVRVTNMGGKSLHNVGVVVTQLSPPPVPMLPVQSPGVLVPLRLEPTITLRAGEQGYLDVLQHHNGTVAVAFVGSAASPFYPAVEGTMIQLQGFSDEAPATPAGRFLVKRMEQNRIIVEAL